MGYWPLIFCLFAAACSSAPPSSCARPNGKTNDASFMGQAQVDRIDNGSSSSVQSLPAELLSSNERQAESPDDINTPVIWLSPARHDFGDVTTLDELKLTFEVVRPNGTLLRLGRVWASCTCVTVSAPKRVFATDGNEPVKIHATLKTDKLIGWNAFIVSVELLEPVKTILQSHLSLMVEN